jgi:hypothetical protein
VELSPSTWVAYRPVPVASAAVPGGGAVEELSPRTWLAYRPVPVGTVVVHYLELVELSSSQGPG